MKKDLKSKWLTTLLLFVLFALFTTAMCFIDVENAGVEGTKIGFAKLNTKVSEMIGYHPALYNAAGVIGYLALGVVACFGLVGLIELIGRRSLLKVDPQILALGCLYVIVGLFYVLFNFVAVNYRPVLIGTTPEASYPSSHTMLGICVYGSAIPMVCSYFRKGSVFRKIACPFLAALAVMTVLTRFLSGVHWLTDIVGSLLLSAALTEFFSCLLLIFPRLLQENHGETK